MKRAKFLLTVIVLFTIAGGTLAFNVKRATDFVYVTDPFDGLCTVKVFGATTRPGGALISIRLVTTILDGACVLQPVYLGK